MDQNLRIISGTTLIIVISRKRTSAREAHPHLTAQQTRQEVVSEETISTCDRCNVMSVRWTSTSVIGQIWFKTRIVPPFRSTDHSATAQDRTINTSDCVLTLSLDSAFCLTLSEEFNHGSHRSHGWERETGWLLMFCFLCFIRAISVIRGQTSFHDSRYLRTQSLD